MRTLKNILLLLTFGIGVNFSAYPQDKLIRPSASSPFFHWQTERDKSLIDTAAYLINGEPTPYTYRTYADLADALWKFSRQDEAKRMFLKILDSNESYYTSTYFHPSDVPGTRSVGLYGYGSFTS